MIILGEKDIEALKEKERAETLFRELHADMRAYRETEQKTVPIFFQVSGFIVAATIVLATEKVHAAYAIPLMILLTVYICLLWFLVDRRIAYDHNNYAYLGRRVERIHELWGVQNFFQVEGRPKLGTGTGSRKSRILVGWSAVCVLVLIIVSLTARLLCHLTTLCQAATSQA